MNKLMLWFSLFSALSCSAFVVPLSLEEKCQKSDTIVRGVVVDIVKLAQEIPDSMGQSFETNTSKQFEGPHAIAVVRVIEVLKKGASKIPDTIFVPCGYNYDESPAELTETKDYVLFLESMGYNFFHPTHAECTHRIQNGRVAKNGWDMDFDEEESEDSPSIPYPKFRELIQAALREEQ